MSTDNKPDWCPCEYGIRSMAAAVAMVAIATERERAARICEQQAHAFLSPEYATDRPLGSFEERFACASCASAIRSPSLKEQEEGN